MPLPPLRRELLLAFGLLFAVGMVVAVVGVAAVLPLLPSPGSVVAYVLALVVADVGILFLFGRAFLLRRLFAPLEGLVADVEAIAGGDLKRRIRPLDSAELQRVADSVNAMADRLIRDQEALAENVRSLDETNRALVEARAQVVRAARLASAGTLASGIAHELGNPLAAVVAYTDVALARARAQGGDLDLLLSIKEEAARMDRIIRTLLDFARAPASMVAPRDPWGAVDRVRQLLEAQGRLAGVEAVWRREGEIPPVLMDERRWEQVVVNLLLNALDAVEGRAGGRIWVTLKEEEGPGARLPRRRAGDPPGVDYAHRRRVMGTTPAGPKGTALATARRLAVLTVEDDGPGIPPELLASIFDPFFTTKEPGKGTGLGLALAAQFVEGMGGEILAGNRSQGGAVFTVRLPEAPGSGDPTPGEEGIRGGHA